MLCELQLALLFIYKGQHLVKGQFFPGIYHCHSHSLLQRLPFVLFSSEIPLYVWSLNSFDVKVYVRSHGRAPIESKIPVL